MDQNEMRLRRETRNQEAVAMAALLLAQPTPPTQQERDWLLSLYTGVGGLVKAEPGSGLFADSKAAEGQYLTPLAVTSFMAEALAIPAGAEVYDNCMGSGRMFYGVPDTCRLVGIELQEEAYRIATAVYKDWPGGTEFFQGDCLEYRMATGELDYALGNPPFGLTWSTEDLAHLDTASTHKGHVLSQKAATELQIRAVRPGGLIGLVVPQGIFGRSDLVTFREWVLTRCLEMARIMLPKQTFEESGTNWPCAIWLLKKHDPQVQGPLDMLRDQPFQATIDTWDWRSQRAKLADAVLDEWRLSTWYVHHVVPYARKVRMQRERAADSLPPGLVTPPQPQPTRSSLDEPTPFDDASFDDASFDDVSFNDDGPVLALRAYPLPPGRSYQLAAGPDGAAITPAHIGHAPAAPADKSAAAVPLNLAPTGEYVITGRPKWKTKQGRTILVGQVTVTGPDGRRHAVFAVGANEFWCSCQTAGCPAVAAVVATRNGKGAKKEPAQIAAARPPAAKPTEPPAKVSEPVEPPTNVPAVSVKWRPRKLGDAPHLSDDELKLRRARRDEWQRQHARQLAEHPEVILARVFANDEAGQALLKEHAEAWRNREDIRVGWWKAGRFSQAKRRQKRRAQPFYQIENLPATTPADAPDMVIDRRGRYTRLSPTSAVAALQYAEIEARDTRIVPAPTYEDVAMGTGVMAILDRWGLRAEPAPQFAGRLRNFFRQAAWHLIPLPDTQETLDQAVELAAKVYKDNPIARYLPTVAEYTARYWHYRRITEELQAEKGFDLYEYQVHDVAVQAMRRWTYLNWDMGLGVRPVKLLV